MATTDPQTISLLPDVFHIEAYQGDTVKIDISVTDEDTGDPIDITNDTVTMTIKRLDGTVVLALTNGTGYAVTDGPAGEGLITITHTQADAMPIEVVMLYDIEWVSAASGTVTLGEGTYTVKGQKT